MFKEYFMVQGTCQRAIFGKMAGKFIIRQRFEVKNKRLTSKNRQTLL